MIREAMQDSNAITRTIIIFVSLCFFCGAIYCLLAHQYKKRFGKTLREAFVKQEHSPKLRKRDQLNAALLELDWMILSGAAIGYSRYLPYNWNPIENGNILYGIIIFVIAGAAIWFMLLPLTRIRNLWIHGMIFLVALSIFFDVVGFFKMWGWV